MKETAKRRNVQKSTRRNRREEGTKGQRDGGVKETSNRSNVEIIASRGPKDMGRPGDFQVLGVQTRG